MNISDSFCTLFLEPAEYKTYLGQIRDTPGGWNATVWICQKEICPTLLGGIDSDIAGMGVSPPPRASFKFLVGGEGNANILA